MAEDSRPQRIAITQALHLLQTFRGADLTQTIYESEKSVRGVSAENYAAVLSTSGAIAVVLGAAGLVKQLAGQINVVIHALGILQCLPRILRPGEIIEYVSLGAGNTGRAFDLETNMRVAEFKFIRWQGGPESIRQNSLFKDFYELVEHETPKEKYLYVLGTEHGEKFFNGGRALPASCALRHYFPRKGLVVIQDVSSFVPELVAAAAEAAETEEE
jgi:hypothetical protein